MQSFSNVNSIKNVCINILTKTQLVYLFIVFHAWYESLWVQSFIIIIKIIYFSFPQFIFTRFPFTNIFPLVFSFFTYIQCIILSVIVYLALYAVYIWNNYILRNVVVPADRRFTLTCCFVFRFFIIMWYLYFISLSIYS